MLPRRTLLLILMVGSARADEPAPWWSLRPLTSPAVPDPASPAWGRTPIDAFILAKLREKGLHPAPEADRRTLIRRVTLDLTGLPPTPAEVDAFVKDPAPDAYDRLVDRLLASPRYGEKQARAWLDLVHYAETHGHDQDRIRPNAWRYRDYVIGSFNADTPYARFIQEQIAGDILFPERPDLTPALGFLASGPWDESSLRDIREDSIDRQVGYYLDRDDMVTTAFNTVLGLTVQCARCHDHKFDPITQAEYYGLQAIFAGVGRADRSYDADPATSARRKSLQARLSTARAGQSKLAIDDAMKKEVSTWEEKLRATRIRWQALTTEEVTTTNGSILKTLDDGSILATGPKPEKESYRITVRLPRGTVTALRLEVLPDDSLAHRGPGRQDNGNLHLSEVILEQRLDGKSVPVPIASAQADYDQPGWTAAHTIDGNPATAWGIYPKIGEAHDIIFVLAKPLNSSGETTLQVRLDQLHGGSHLIGRLRLTATTSDPRLTVPLSPALQKLIEIPAKDRTPAQWQELVRLYQIETTEAELASLPAPTKVYAIAADFTADGSHRPVATPRPVHVLKRGEIRRPGAQAVPGGIAAVPGTFPKIEGASEGARRAALARWLTDPKNPLPWRVIVNRLWQSHFGVGIVSTPSDFGIMGSLPSHPELLDWLARDFLDHGGSMKHLHRLIVTSSTYRQSTRHDPEAAKVDGDNRLLGRMNRRRLEAEELRDGILQVAGRLDLTMGGPSDQQFSMRPGVHVTPVVDYDAFRWDRPDGHRRSIYRFVYRTLPDPFVECFDGADATTLTPVRSVSITALQGLSLLNQEVVLVHARILASDLEKRFPQAKDQVQEMARRLWGRGLTEQEQTEMMTYAQQRGLVMLARMLLNSNEFLFVD